MDDEDMADLNGGGDDFIWSSEIDFDYEFDVCRFFDFTKPESDAEAFEAERWFDFAPGYPPSPFIVKLNLEKDFSVEVEKSRSPKVQGCDNLKSISNKSNVGNNHGISSLQMNAKGLKQQNRTKGIVKAEKKSTGKSIKPSSSTLLKPTASHLAKQKKSRDLNSSRRGRLPNLSSKMDEGELQKSLGHEIEATKRQKLETGYLRKVAQLKHQNSMLHKIVKKAGQLEGSSIYSRSRTTVPREPDLETAHRAQKRSFKSKNVPDSTQCARSNTHGFKARPLNRKILQAPLPLLKKSMPPVTEFQVFHLKTTERALQHKSANILKVHNRNSALQRVGASKIFPSIEDESLIENILPHDPPTELFNKLSLRSGTEKNTKSQPKQHRPTKGSKENVPSSFQPEFRKCLGKPNKCGNEMRIPEVRCQPNNNRSVGIR